MAVQDGVAAEKLSAAEADFFADFGLMGEPVASKDRRRSDRSTSAGSRQPSSLGSRQASPSSGRNVAQSLGSRQASSEEPSPALEKMNLASLGLEGPTTEVRASSCATAGAGATPEGPVRRRRISLPNLKIPSAPEDGLAGILERRGYTLKDTIGRGANSDLVVRRVGAAGGDLVGKCVHERAGEGNVRRILRHEYSILKAIQHPGIVLVKDFVECASGCVLLQELCAGVSLQRAMAKAAWTASEQHAIASKILGAVVHLHDLGVAHRDLHAGNVMVEAAFSQAVSVKLVDFGSARNQSKDGAYDLNDAIFADDVNVEILPPEGSGRRDDMFSCDVFALGLLVLGLMRKRAQQTASIYVGGVLRLELPETVAPEVDSYLRALLSVAAGEGPTAHFAREFLPLVGQWHSF